MKVIGTGAPAALTIRFERSELDVLRDELREMRAVVTEAAACAHQHASGSGAGGGTIGVETRHRELVEIARALDRLDSVEADPTGAPVEFEGPSWFWAPVIRGAAGDACERLVDATDRFRDVERRCSPDDLRRRPQPPPRGRTRSPPTSSSTPMALTATDDASELPAG